MAMNNRLMRPVTAADVSAAVTYHPEALAWQDAVVANGGSVGSSLPAVSDFCDAIDAAGIRDRFLRVNLVCGANLAAARTPLYRGPSPSGTQYGNAIDTNVGPFVEFDYGQSVGLSGDGFSKCLDTGLTIGTLASATGIAADYDNVHVSVYRRDEQSGPDFGGNDYYAIVYGNSCLLDTTNYWYGDPYFHAGSANMGEGLEVLGVTGTGFHLVESTGSGEIWLRNNSNAFAQSYSNLPQPFNAADDTPLYAGGTYSNYDDGNGVAEYSFYSAGVMAAYSVGIPLGSSGARTAYYNAMLAFQTALGRNV